jgi:hypothetical protein
MLEVDQRAVVDGSAGGADLAGDRGGDDAARLIDARAGGEMPGC